MRMSVIGGGYVGLILSACFAEKGHFIRLIESDSSKVDVINSGRSPAYEPGLEVLLSDHIGKNLIATTCYDGIRESDVIFICVGTPPMQNGDTDLTMVVSASKSIGETIKDSKRYHAVVVKSTVPPGTTENLVMQEVTKYSDKSEIGFAMNPEFLREGHAIEDFMHPDRTVIGCNETRTGSLIESIYKEFDAPIIRTEIIEAEMIKYASNAMLATKISFSNEIGNICKRLGIDVYSVMKGVGMDHRINPYFLDAGAGFGGSCFPKDVASLIRVAEKLGYDPLLLKSVMNVNDQQPRIIVELLGKRLGNIHSKSIAILGLAFKKDTDDIRGSRAISVIRELMRAGANIRAYDPLASNNACREIPGLKCYPSAKDALKDADACIIMTEWPEFSQLDEEFKVMKSRVVLEGRRISSCKDVEGICW
jgi:UDPglucose 6-dehydrogenase